MCIFYTLPRTYVYVYVSREHTRERDDICNNIRKCTGRTKYVSGKYGSNPQGECLWLFQGVGLVELEQEGEKWFGFLKITTKVKAKREENN